MVLVDDSEALVILTEKEVNNNKEPRVKKMGPNSELHSSSLKIRKKRFLNSIFWNLRYICVLKPFTSSGFFRAIILPIYDL
ncbi:hypothetical protein C1H46_043939 [Malus baccata]|uniref:Uncharacterized protein n=1 Tax=Malus baccata TaxID=106549 RepID=A0A540K9B4_MALBA|nr:hypothetical protein C1H46_043939 [Malus baccata]